MKALPVKLAEGRYVSCPVDEASHVILNIPGPAGRVVLAVIRSGTRQGTPCWTWNGSTEAPTLRPSVLLSNAKGVICHSWINDGQAQFLSDSPHEYAGQTVPLLEVKDYS